MSLLVDLVRVLVFLLSPDDAALFEIAPDEEIEANYKDRTTR